MTSKVFQNMIVLKASRVITASSIVTTSKVFIGVQMAPMSSCYKVSSGTEGSEQPQDKMIVQISQGFLVSENVAVASLKTYVKVKIQ